MGETCEVDMTVRNEQVGKWLVPDQENRESMKLQIVSSESNEQGMQYWLEVLSDFNIFNECILFIGVFPNGRKATL